MGKTFDSILDTRLAIFTKENDTYTKAQYGSKLEHNAIDAMFPLLSHIQSQKMNNKVIYCAMLDFETAYPLVSRPQLYLNLHDRGIQDPMLTVLKSLTKTHHVRVLHPYIKEHEYVEIQRGLAEGSALSPRLYAMFLSSLLQRLRDRFPNVTCAGRNAPQWIGPLAYVDDLCLCVESISFFPY